MVNKSKWWKILLKAALWIIGIWAVLLVVLQLTLSEKVLTKLVNKYAAEYIDGDISFGGAKVSMFKKFPRVCISLDDFSITYPADRFDEQEKMGVQGYLMNKGCGETADTLASFDRFSASLDVFSLAGGTIKIPHLRLVKPRIFAHAYANGDTNWDIFLIDSEDEEVEEDTTSTSLPNISLGRISLSDHPHIVYTDSRDTIFAMIDVARIGFNGKISTKSKITSRNKVGLSIDNLRIAGRIKKDTVAFSMQKFYVHEDGDHMDIDAEARAMLATRSFGRIHLPITMAGELSFPKDTVPAVKLKGFKANVGDFPFVADAYLRIMDDRTGVQAKIGLKDCQLNDVFHGFAKNIIPELEKVQTDAKLTMLAECDGDYVHATGQLPKIYATISMPEAELAYSDLENMKIRLGVAASGNTDNQGRINAALDSIQLKTSGLYLDLRGGAQDLMGADPALTINGNLHASLDTIATMLPDTLGISATGKLAARLEGNARMSHLSIYNFSRANITGNISGDLLTIKMPSDTIDVEIKGLDITLAPEDRASRRDTTRKFRLIGVTATLNQADIAYGSSLNVKAKDLFISAKNSSSSSNPDDTTARINPLSGRFKAERLIVRDAASTSLNLKKTNNSFMLMPKKGQPQVPMLTLSSRNERIALSSGRNRVILTDANLKASAGMNTVERKLKAKAFRDSLAKVYPEVPKDSLFKHMMAQSRRRNMTVPEWMQEEDFKKQDIDIKLDETMAKYFRDWDIKGNIGVETGIVVTPYFPLKNQLHGFELNFTNNEVKVDSFKVVSGKSDLAMKGSLTGLRNALLGRGRSALLFNLDITSENMDANELLTAYKKGSLYVPSGGEQTEISDAELLEMVTSEDTISVADTTVPSLIVIPANLVANVNLTASNVKYTDLIADEITAKVVMKERCVQITDTKAKTNMGDMSFDAFYSTRTKKDLKAGFSLNFEDITADRVINLMPSIDTIMPLLKSFHGLLNCEIAATAQLDTNMNLIIPSVNGIIRISGDDLSITGSDMYRSLARKLLFKNKKEGHIEKMTVEGMIQDNSLEVFPFIIHMDRYMLALSGVQNMDMSYKYHASLIKSPFLIKLGLDVYGDDFDNMKFKIGRAKYKNGNVPAFSSVIDETKINLVESIHNIFDKGVDAAFKENIMQSAILDHKRNINYVRAIDIKLEELSPDEQKQVEADEAAEEVEEAAETTEVVNTENK